MARFPKISYLLLFVLASYLIVAECLIEVLIFDPIYPLKNRLITVTAATRGQDRGKYRPTDRNTYYEFSQSVGARKAHIIVCEGYLGDDLSRPEYFHQLVELHNHAINLASVSGDQGLLLAACSGVKDERDYRLLAEALVRHTMNHNLEYLLITGIGRFKDTLKYNEIPLPAANNQLFINYIEDFYKVPLDLENIPVVLSDEGIMKNDAAPKLIAMPSIEQRATELKHLVHLFLKATQMDGERMTFAKFKHLLYAKSLLKEDDPRVMLKNISSNKRLRPDA